jgi:glycerol-3-phosphate acyltransferase PlsY
VFGLSHYVSLGSLTAAFSFPIVTLLILQHDKTVMVVFSLVLACLVVLTHRKNIVRLLNGTENKIYLFGRRN